MLGSDGSPSPNVPVFLPDIPGAQRTPNISVDMVYSLLCEEMEHRKRLEKEIGLLKKQFEKSILENKPEISDITTPNNNNSHSSISNNTITTRKLVNNHHLDVNDQLSRIESSIVFQDSHIQGVRDIMDSKVLEQSKKLASLQDVQKLTPQLIDSRIQESAASLEQRVVGNFDTYIHKANQVATISPAIKEYINEMIVDTHITPLKAEMSSMKGVLHVVRSQMVEIMHQQGDLELKKMNQEINQCKVDITEVSSKLQIYLDGSHISTMPNSVNSSNASGRVGKNSSQISADFVSLKSNVDALVQRHEHVFIALDRVDCFVQGQNSNVQALKGDVGALQESQLLNQKQYSSIYPLQQRITSQEDKLQQQSQREIRELYGITQGQQDSTQKCVKQSQFVSKEVRQVSSKVQDSESNINTLEMKLNSRIQALGDQIKVDKSVERLDRKMQQQDQEHQQVLASLQGSIKAVLEKTETSSGLVDEQQGKLQKVQRGLLDVSKSTKEVPTTIATQDTQCNAKISKIQLDMTSCKKSISTLTSQLEEEKNYTSTQQETIRQLLSEMTGYSTQLKNIQTSNTTLTSQLVTQDYIQQQLQTLHKTVTFESEERQEKVVGALKKHAAAVKMRFSEIFAKLT